MIVRLLERPDGEFQLLCADGSIINSPSRAVLYKLLTEFEEAETVYGTDGRWNEVHSEMSLFPGDTCALVTDDKKLMIFDFKPFASVIRFSDIKYISAQEYAEKHNKSVEIIKVYCRQHRIVGAQRIGQSWVVPEDAPYPVPPQYQRDYNPLAGRPSKKQKDKQNQSE